MQLTTWEGMQMNYFVIMESDALGRNRIPIAIVRGTSANQAVKKFDNGLSVDTVISDGFKLSFSGNGSRFDPKKTYWAIRTPFCP